MLLGIEHLSMGMEDCTELQLATNRDWLKARFWSLPFCSTVPKALKSKVRE